MREDRDFALDNEAQSAAELKDWVKAGGRTIIEMSAIDFGRDIAAVERIARQVPEAHVIAITGFMLLCLGLVWWIFRTGYRLKS